MTDKNKNDAGYVGEGPAAVRKSKAKKRPTKAKYHFFERADADQIADRLRAHIMGEIEMSASQVNAALTLLKQIIQSAAVIDEAAVEKADTPLCHEDMLALISQFDREE